jgi:ribosomal protein S6--L-glutamate ligase
VRDVATGLGVDHAGFDIMMIDGHPWLLEFNTLFGNEALNRQGIRVEPAILNYLQHTVPIRHEPEKSSQVTA